jgi:hypothetical protein
MLFGSPDAASASKNRRSTYSECRVTSGRLDGSEFVVDCRRILRTFSQRRSELESAWKAALSEAAAGRRDSSRASNDSTAGTDRVNEKPPARPATLAKIVHLAFKLFGDKLIDDDARRGQRSHTIADLSPTSALMRKASLTEEFRDGAGRSDPTGLCEEQHRTILFARDAFA